MGINRLAAVGAFVIGGIALFAIGLFMIGDRRMLFTDTFTVYAEFSDIAALDRGATVRVSGMDAGEVDLVQVPPGPSGRFRVRMRVRTDLHPLIRLDSVATIQNDGLVGNKFVQIETGTEKSPIVPDSGTVLSREPFDFTDLLQKMSDTIDSINRTIVDVKDELDNALVTISDTATTANSLINDVGKDARAIMSSSQRVAADLQTIVSGVRDGRGSVGKLLTDDALFVSAKKIASDAEQVMTNLRTVSDQAKQAIADFRGAGNPVKGLTVSLDETLASARDVMADLAENTEALKRNFLFRGFFNRRGYFDLADISVQQYREGALETNDRRVLRIWLSADVLFERDPTTNMEKLSDGGRNRLDSAMSTFVKYPRTSPFVIEGYGHGTTEDERYLLSRSRAELVRDYVQTKFRLDPKYVAIMPMGAEAAGSPSGNAWDGVALAMFVHKSAR
jgi:phospholipid/cholesterol/gamma-HCH transport system substrate-binding protein